MTKREYKLFVSLKAMRGEDYAKDAILKLRNKPIENMREAIFAAHQALKDNEDFQQTL